MSGFCRFGDKCRNEHPRGEGKVLLQYNYCIFIVIIINIIVINDGFNYYVVIVQGLGSSSGGFRQTSRSTGQWNSSYCNQVQCSWTIYQNYCILLAHTVIHIGIVITHRLLFIVEEQII